MWGTNISLKLPLETCPYERARLLANATSLRGFAPREPTKVPPKSHPHMPKVISTSNKNITSKLRSLEASKCLGGSRNAKSISKLNIKTGGKSTTGVSKMDPQRPRNSELRTLNPELCYYMLYDT